MSSFFFNLQRFADEISVANDSTSWENYMSDALSPKAEAPPVQETVTEEPVKEVETKESEAKEEKTEKAEPVADTGKHKIKVGGEEIEMTLEQLKARAQMGEDYTRKTQAVSEERKKVEEEKARVQEILQELEASKINKPVEQPPVEQQPPGQPGTDNARDMFRRTYGAEYEWFNEEHQDKMLALTKQSAIAEAKNEILSMFRKEQEVQQQSFMQREFQELARFANTEPKEVLDFAIQAINSVAQTDPERFIILYNANKKVMANQAITMTYEEAKTLKEHAIASRSAFYGSVKPKEEKKEVQTESSSSSVKTEKQFKGADVRDNKDLAESMFEKYMKGG